MTKNLAKSDADTIRKAIADAEQGQATLTQLSAAHALAEKAEAARTLGVLRMHIRRLTPQPLFHSEMKSVALGILSGLITWTILGRRPGAS